MYAAEGFSALSIQLESATLTNSPTVPGTWSVYSGTTITGSNPSTNTSSGVYSVSGFAPWVRVNTTTTTGTGSIQVIVFGWRSPSFISSTAAYPPSNFFQTANNLSEGNAATMRTNLGAASLGANTFTAPQTVADDINLTKTDTNINLTGGGLYIANNGSTAKLRLINNGADSYIQSTGTGNLLFTAPGSAVMPGMVVYKANKVDFQTTNGLQMGGGAYVLPTGITAATSPSGFAGELRITNGAGATLGYILIYSNP